MDLLATLLHRLLEKDMQSRVSPGISCLSNQAALQGALSWHLGLT